MRGRTGYQVGAILLLALFGWLGVRSSMAVGGPSLTRGQQAVTLLQWCYALLALLAIVGLLARHAGTRLVLYAWAALFTIRNALTVLYFGGKAPVLVLVGGVIGLAISAGVLYLAFRALEPDDQGTAS